MGPSRGTILFAATARVCTAGILGVLGVVCHVYRGIVTGWEMDIVTETRSFGVTVLVGKSNSCPGILGVDCSTVGICDIERSAAVSARAGELKRLDCVLPVNGVEDTGRCVGRGTFERVADKHAEARWKGLNRVICCFEAIQIGQYIDLFLKEIGRITNSRN